jgi:hypothetical protein
MAPYQSVLRSHLLWTSWLCFVFSTAFLMGCADRSDHPQRGGDAVGAIYFRISWETADEPEAPPARFVCGSGSDQVAFVDARLFNDEHTINLNTPWDCADGSGTIDQVPVGSGYTLTISAYREDGAALYSAERIEISVLPGVNDLGIVNATRFVTSTVAPEPDATDVNITGPVFSWEAATGAAGYQLLISISADLRDPVYSATLDDLSATLADDILTAESQYWWAVVPVDFDGRPGVLGEDQVYAFSTADACPAGDDHGDDPASATLIAENDVIQGEIECSNDRDYFRFELSSPLMVTIFTEGTTDTAGYLLDADGSERSYDDDSGADSNFLIEANLSAGTYFIAVQGYQNGTGVYTLGLATSSAPVISGVYDVLDDPFADYCVNSSGGTFSGYAYFVYFDYQDPDGDAGTSDGAYVTLNDQDWEWVSIGGDGASGTVSISYCSTSAGNQLVLKLVDGAGGESNPLTIDLTPYP